MSACALIGLAALIAAGVLASRYLTAETRALDAARDRAQAQSARAAASIDGTMRAIVAPVEQLAADLAAARADEREILRVLDAALNTHSTLVAVGVAFEPYAFAPRQRLYAPYLTREGGEPRRVARLEDRYDYTAFRHRWYGDVILDGPTWAVASLDPEKRQNVALYGIPLPSSSGGPPAGVVFAAVPLGTLAATYDASALGTSGYAFVFARDGRYLLHPHRELVQNGETIFQTAWQSGNTALHSMAVRAVKGESGFVEATEPLTGETDWIFYAPIPATGWTVASVFFQHEFEPDDTERRRTLFLLVTAALIGVLGLGTAALVPLLGRRAAMASAGALASSTGLWWHSLAIALLVSAAVVALWWIADRHPADAGAERFRIVDQAGVEQFLASFNGDAESDDARTLLRIPTGILVRSIAFQSSTDVVVSGYVWQRYTVGAHDGLTRGVTFAEAEGLSTTLMTEIYRTRDGSEERIGWQFVARLRQDFSYRKYPFDRQDVWVRLRPAQFRRDVVLVPDFESYRIMAAAALPGVATDLVLPGWELIGSHFDYRVTRYNADFGLESFSALEDMPELYFNASVRRLFIGPFVSYILPVSVTIAMVFAVLVITSRRDRTTSFLGFTAADSLRSAAALFFVASFQHVALRNTLASPVIMYFEYFYFALYLAIMFVSLNAILFGAQLGIRVIEHRENLVPKLVFFPLYATALFLITFATFY